MADLIVGLKALLLDDEFDITLRSHVMDIITECERLFWERRWR